MSVQLNNQQPDKLTINIDGPEGNVFCILGTARELADQLGLDEAESNHIQQDMRSGDYIHALQVFDQHFGKYVTILTSNEEIYESLI